MSILSGTIARTPMVVRIKPLDWLLILNLDIQKTFKPENYSFVNLKPYDQWKYLVFHEDKFLGLGEIDETFCIKPLKVLSNRRKK